MDRQLLLLSLLEDPGWPTRQSHFLSPPLSLRPWRSAEVHDELLQQRVEHGGGDVGASVLALRPGGRTSPAPGLENTRRCCPCCCSRRPAATASARAKKSMNARAPPVAPSSTSSTSPLLPRSALRPPQRWRTRTPSSGTCGRVPSEPVLVHHPVRLAPHRRLPAVEHQ